MSISGTLLERVILPQTGALPVEAAKYFLQLDFPAAGQDGVKQLSAKAREGTLSAEERELLDEYLFMNDLLALLHSKSRLSLQHDNAAA